MDKWGQWLTCLSCNNPTSRRNWTNVELQMAFASATFTDDRQFQEYTHWEITASKRFAEALGKMKVKRDNNLCEKKKGTCRLIFHASHEDDFTTTENGSLYSFFTCPFWISSTYTWRNKQYNVKQLIFASTMNE